MFLLYILILSLAFAGAQENTLSSTILTQLIGEIAVLKHTHELQLNELRAKMQTQEERILDLEKRQEQVQLNLKECIDDTAQKHSAVQEQMASHENNLLMLMSVFRSMRTNIGGLQTALYGQKLWMQNYNSREKNDTLVRLTKLESQFTNASKAHCVAGSYSSTGLVPCTLCEIGTYQTSAGSTSCTNCGEGTWTATTGSTADTDCKVPRISTDCGDFKGSTSGVYKIKPQSVVEPFSVYCDMQTEGEGWTVFQRRQDGSMNFYRDWSSYETGFGDLMGEFWLGNHFIHSITNQGSYELRVNISDFDGNFAYAHYNVFSVGNASSNYLLTVSGYNGNAGDDLTHLNNMFFSTYDKDHDSESSNCAATYKGAWWYNYCHSNPNGMYHEGTNNSFLDGVNWHHWKGWYYSLKSTTMSVRRVH